jgi:hypothetical protein
MSSGGQRTIRLAVARGVGTAGRIDHWSGDRGHCRQWKYDHVATPLHCTFSPKDTAQVMRFNPDSHTVTGVGIEDLYIYGGGGGHSCINFINCALLLG